MSDLLTNLGIVLIGRNERAHLKRAIDSLPLGINSVIYVDSGSADGSAEYIEAQHFPVHRLSSDKPFSAARARQEGFEILLTRFPYVEWVQFIDGDCALCEGWVESALEYLKNNPRVGVVCGMLEETAPYTSIFNRMNSLHWKTAQIGDITACGGIFMTHKAIFSSVGGFNTRLLTGEEAEFCGRVRAMEFKVVRLNKKMAQHDSALVTFSAWWRRAVWGGRGDAQRIDLIGKNSGIPEFRKYKSSLLWAFWVPLLSITGAILSTIWTIALILPITGIGTYLLILFKIMHDRKSLGDEVGDALLYSALCILRKFPYLFGFLSYRYSFKTTSRFPDPHSI